jgi:hypothetical protein
MDGFGLTIGINADPSQAQAATAGLKTSLGEAVAAIEQAGEGMSGGLLNARQSLYLLAEEMDIHLPRAVVPDQQQLSAELTRYQTPPELVRRVTEEINREAEAQERLKRSYLDIELHTRAAKQDMENLNQVLGQQIPLYQEAAVQTENLTFAKRLENVAQEALAGSYAQEIAGLVEMIAARRAAAAVLAVWDAAKAAEAFAEWDIPAGINYTLASARYALVAGGVGAGGGADAGSTARGLSPRAGAGYGYGPGGSSPGLAPGALAPGSTPAPGGQLTVMVMGEPSAAQWLATNVLNPFVRRGGTLMASTAQRVPASGG